MKKHQNKILTLTLLMSVAVAHAQWDSTSTQYYDFTTGALYSNDMAEDIDKDASGNYYVAGEISNSTANQDVHIIKYKTNGTNSSINYTTTNFNETVRKVLCSGNLIFVINNSFSAGFQNDQMSILRYNSSLVLQNAAYYISDSLYAPVDACLDGAGNIYLACRQRNGSHSNIAIVKLTAGTTNISAITKVFYSSLTDNYTEEPKDIYYSTTTNRIYVAGGITNNSNGNTATLLVNIDAATMSEQWRKTSSFLSGRNILNSVIETATNVFAAGCKKDGLNNNNNFYVVRYSLLGTNGVSAKYTGPSIGYNYNEALEIVSGGSSFVKIVGCSKDSTGNKYDIIYAEFASALTTSPSITSQTLLYNSEIKDAGYESGSGNVYVTGRKKVGANQNMFFYAINGSYRDSIINRNACGNKMYVVSAAPGTNASAKLIGYQDKNSNIQPTDLKFFYRKYFDNGIARIGSEATTENADVELYPNPASDQFSIRSSEKITHLMIIDAIGKVVYESQPGSEIFESQIDISYLKSGLYFITVNSRKVQKLIKQ